MARRRDDHRTWDQLSREERRRGLAILIGIGVVAVVGVLFAFGRTGADAQGGAASPPTVDLDAEISAWYESTAQVRTAVAAAAVEVRTHITANDGIALEPACGALTDAARDAVEAPAAPVEAARLAWSNGADAYSRAAQSCNSLFDGTPVPPPTLLARTTEELGTADGHWARLASDLGEPALVVPTS